MSVIATMIFKGHWLLVILPILYSLALENGSGRKYLRVWVMKRFKLSRCRPDRLYVQLAEAPLSPAWFTNLILRDNIVTGGETASYGDLVKGGKCCLRDAVA